LVGAGVIARLAQLPVLSADPSVTIAGVVTASPEESDETVRRWPIERAYRDLDAMIDQAQLDALFVLTPKTAHRSFVERGLEAGLDVFCEKPLASDLDDAGAMVEAGERASGLVMVGLNRRYAEVYVRARAEFAERRPDFVVGQKHRVGTEYRATLENGIHMVDLLRWFCGEAVEVTGAAAGDDLYREDGAAALIRFASGAVALFAAARTAGEWDERLEAYGDQTSVRVVAPDGLEISRGGVRTNLHMRPRSAGWADITETAGFGPAIRHFLHCVRTREAPRTDAREAYRSQELMERVLAAAGLPIRDAA
jgi:virulence factor